MNKKKVDSILKGITAAGIAMGGVSSIQGADMVMAAINESAADSDCESETSEFYRQPSGRFFTIGTFQRFSYAR